MFGTYAWVIDKDYSPDPEALPGTNSNAVGVSGPRAFNKKCMDLLTETKQGIKFRLCYDTDGSKEELAERVTYAGRLVYIDEGTLYTDNVDNADEIQAFGPLNDFGTPNAGCAWIEYKNKEGKWEVL